MNRIKLGDKVRSTVSGFSGTVTAICHYLYNESQYCVKQNALVNGDEKVCWFSIGELTTAPNARWANAISNKFPDRVARGRFNSAPGSKTNTDFQLWPN